MCVEIQNNSEPENQKIQVYVLFGTSSFHFKDNESYTT